MSPDRAPRYPVLLVLSALLLLAACNDTATTAPSPGGAAPTGASVGPSVPTPWLPAGLTPATVTRVVDGDTIEVEINGETFKLRYIGINTPETVDPRRPVECFGHEASDYNKQLVQGKTVGLEKDVSETDQYGRLLRYVWLDPSTSSRRAEMVNAILVREGYAQASTYPPDVKYQELFSSLQAEAAANARGLWGAACAETPSSSPIVAASPGGGVCDYSGTSEPLIKGNISLSSGEKIYHVPGGYYYDDTVINEAAGERWFCTEAEAVAAGWRKAKR